MKRLIPFLAVTIGTLMASVALWGGTASAWQPVLSGRATCMSEGSWTVEWSIRNSQTGAGEVMTFDSAEVNGTLIMMSPISVAPGASATAKSTQTVDTASATLVVVARWANSTPNVVVSADLTVTRPDCATSGATTTTTTAVENSAATTTTAVENSAATTTTTSARTTMTTTSTAAAAAAVRARSLPPTTTTLAPSTVRPAPAATSPVGNGAVAGTAGVASVATSGPASEVESRAAGTTSLPTTGAPTVPLVVAGAGLVLTGITLLTAARRRNATT